MFAPAWDSTRSLLYTGANGKAIPKEASILAVVINLIFVGAMLLYGYAVVREELDSSKKATAMALHNQVPSPLLNVDGYFIIHVDASL